MSGIFGNMFDFNRDGKFNAAEKAADIAALQEVLRQNDELTQAQEAEKSGEIYEYYTNSDSDNQSSFVSSLEDLNPDDDEFEDDGLDEYVDEYDPFGIDDAESDYKSPFDIGLYDDDDEYVDEYDREIGADGYDF